MSRHTEAVSMACRAQLEALVIATTGAIALASIATGYTRTTGSFVADGFVVGQEITATGFPGGMVVDVITEVTPLRVGVARTLPVVASATGRTLRMLPPALRVYGNRSAEPSPDRPFLETDCVSQPGELLSGPAAHGVVEERGLYVVRWYAPLDTGELGLRRTADALLRAFPPGMRFEAGPVFVRVRGDVIPWSGSVLRVASHACVVSTIPWRVIANNS
jgi:hypothetical protein